MLALLSTPVRRWLLASLLIPVLVVALQKSGRFVERRHDDRPTRLSRVLLKLSSVLARFSSRHRKSDSADAEAMSARR